MEIAQQLIDIVLHMDSHLNNMVATLGPWIYVIIFLIIFCETGLVVTPFLPGDSLLFALGALCAVENAYLKLEILLPILIIAGILGDGANYAIGNYIGPKIFNKETGRWLRKDHLIKTQNFYKKYGGKTIILARFMPIIRTFAPFVAGIGTMHYSKFLVYNMVGAVSWVGVFLLSGYFFGNIPTVKHNFHLVIIGIIIFSLMPMIIEYIKSRREKSC